ncbi:hypothetical protein [Vreelandella populi]|uniref:Uncharacterized protein n=1 Tax=Vreelandella populi TaxID=2498858 RepID=A0A3S0YLD6_9GAMM|nr:hypothetical protein [Halomonas populi]RUR48813.1 hypothetical protein ELY37_02885 [Halomonas populi]
MTIDTFFALVQIPLAIITAALYGRQYGRSHALGYKRLIWLAIAAVSCGMGTWRLGTISQLVDPMYRAAGGMTIQTLYQIVVLIAYGLMREHSGQAQK